MDRTSDRTSKGFAPHTGRTQAAPPARAPLNNQEFCDELVGEGRLSACSPSLLRKFLTAIKPYFEQANIEPRDADQKLTPETQDAIRLWLDVDRDEAEFSRQFFQRFDFNPIDVTPNPTVAGGLALSTYTTGSNLLNLADVIDIPSIEIPSIEIGEVDMSVYESRLSRFSEEIANYTEVGDQARQTKAQIDAANLAALQKSAIEKAIRDHELEQAIYERTRAALAAKQGLGK
jgi:hypothetical protein